MSTMLVAYFSASGTTQRLAQRLASVIDAPLYQILPEVPYTQADLNWRDRISRSSLEMQDLSSRPPLADHDAPVADADVIFVGFPIWWYREPSIIDTFLEAYDLAGKTIVPFATSGGSGMGDTASRMREIAGEGVTVLDGACIAAGATTGQLEAWVAGLGL